MSSRPVTAGVIAGVYPERDDTADTQAAGSLTDALHAAGNRLRGRANNPKRFVSRVNGLADELRSQSDAQLQVQTAELRAALRREGLQEPLVARSFAIIREVAERTIGLRHFDVQLIGGWVMLQGAIAEMETGEGKTLTASLTAGTVALSGTPVHIVTVNDYLAQRDRDAMAPIYEALGLSVAAATQDMELSARRDAYACDVAYCTNKTITFDYLRDQMRLGTQKSPLHMRLDRLYGAHGRTRELLLRGLYFAIVDEADSVLIDEARTPLIISDQSQANDEEDMVKQALDFARQLNENAHFSVNRGERQITLTKEGKAQAAELVTSIGGLWAGTKRREELVTQALTAIHLFEADKHYLVRDDKVQIIDEFTGRVMPDRSWERGLHQMVEAKEGCRITSRKEPLARISYQRFFRRYHRLAGMTGTAHEVRGELASVYRLKVHRVPTNRPANRTVLPTQVFATAEQKWRAIVTQIDALHSQGRPVLVGTHSVAASEHASQLLTAAGLAHQVLNARQDQGEAEIIAQAGEAGRITIATNMAGRGTDIRLAPGVAEAGGLCVILTERHEARRIDRQLAGRCARQGDPGTFAAILSLEDELVQVYDGSLAYRIVRACLSGNRRLGHRIGEWAQTFAQHRAERMFSRMRRQLLKADKQMGTTLAFTGRPE